MENLLFELNDALLEQNGELVVEVLNEDYFYETFFDENDEEKEQMPDEILLKKFVNQCIGNVSNRAFILNYYNALLYFYGQEDYKNSFKSMNQAVSDFISHIYDKEANDVWTVPIMKFLASALNKYGMKAMKVSESEETSSDEEGPLEQAARVLQRAFSVSTADRSDLSVSKKWGALHIVNVLLRIYFQLNKLGLCTKLIQNVTESRSLPDLEIFPVAQRVTYRFFSGRVAILQSKLQKAKDDLEYALVYCHESATHNKKMILRYLACVNLMLGKYPTESLCKKYGMDEFLEISKACRSGDLRNYKRNLEKHMKFFIEQGTYLMLEKIKVIVYRNLLRRVCSISAQNARLSIDLFRVALNFVEDEPVDMDETEAILSNLIYSGYLKGYMSHEKQILVLSKVCAFPPLNQVV